MTTRLFEEGEQRVRPSYELIPPDEFFFSLEQLARFKKYGVSVTAYDDYDLGRTQVHFIVDDDSPLYPVLNSVYSGELDPTILDEIKDQILDDSLESNWPNLF